MPKLILIDGSSYLYRAFHALPPLSNSQGEPTGALFGIVNMLRATLKARPDYVAFVSDAPGPNFRNALYELYKANRPPMPDDLRAQVEPMLAIVSALGFPILRVDGVEADDVIGTLTEEACAQGIEVEISTSDKDLAQLVRPGVQLVNTMTNTTTDTAGVMDKFGVQPSQIIDFLTLTGDTVDNVPGVPKCGPKTAAGPVEYFDRGAIERGALAGQGLEIAWLVEKVDAFFIHVQGAARLNMTDGRLTRVTYAAKSGQRFTGPGKILSDLGEIPLEKVTMQSIRAWFKAHPERIDEILWQNRSYIFFCEAPVEDAALGPIAAAKVPLTPGRSVAVDRLLHTFGTPFYIDAPTLSAFDRKPFRRLMIAQDTGSAITGPARGDLFAGSGDAAGEIAGVVRNAADFYALVPRSLLDGRRR